MLKYSGCYYIFRNITVVVVVNLTRAKACFAKE